MNILHTWWLPKDDSLLKVRFVKNEEGKREAQQIDEDKIGEHTPNPVFIGHGKETLNEEDKWVAQQISEHNDHEHIFKQKIWVMIIGHIGHTQTEIIELLNRQGNKIDAEVIIVQTEIPEHRWSLEALAQERKEQVLISIEKTCKEMSDIFFEKRKKPQHANIYYTPKVQKAKIQTRKFILNHQKNK